MSAMAGVRCSPLGRGASGCKYQSVNFCSMIFIAVTGTSAHSKRLRSLGDTWNGKLESGNVAQSFWKPRPRCRTTKIAESKTHDLLDNET